MNRSDESIITFCVDNIRPPDRRSMVNFLEDVRFTLPGSLRSERFRIDISPWLKLPMTFVDDPAVRRLTCMASIQSSKSTLGEACIVKAQATDPGNMLYNWEDAGKASEIWDERIEKTIRQCPALSHRMPSKRIRQKKQQIMFTDGFYFRMQGAFATKSRQSKSVRYLINEEVKDWKPGAYKDMLNRVTASWNSFVLNITPGSVTGDEMFQAWQESSQHTFHMICPKCALKQLPRFRVVKDKKGGLHLCDPEDEEATLECKPDRNKYNYQAITKHLYYECEGADCNHRWKDTPSEREQIASTGVYVAMNPDALPTDKGVKWNAVVVPWISWVQLVREFHEAIAGAKYGDLSMLQEFVQKREADFWNPERDDFDGEEVQLSKEIRKSREGLEDKQYRIMTVDKQRGSVRKGETPHYWCVVRDWAPGKSALLFEGRIDTDEDLEAMREDLEVLPVFVWVDSGDGITMMDVYRMCAKYGYVAIKGEDKSGYYHNDKNGKTSKRYAPEQAAVVTLESGQPAKVPLILYSKQGIRDALYYMREAKEFDFQTPEDVSEDYKLHHKAERLVDWTIPKTQQVVQIWKQYKKRNDLFVCECYQALIADVLGMIGTVPIQQRDDVPKTHPSKS